MTCLFIVGPRAIIAPIPSSTRPARRHRRPERRSPGVTSIDDRDLRLEGEGGGARAVQADLLLHRGNRDDVDLRVARLRDASSRLERDVRAEPVVE